MAEKSRTFGVDPDRLAKLLSVGSTGDRSMPEVSADDEKVELLLDRLAEPLLLDPSFVRLLPDVPHLLSNAMELCGEDSIEDLLLNKDVEVGLLKKVKDEFRQGTKGFTYDPLVGKRQKPPVERQ